MQVVVAAAVQLLALQVHQGKPDQAEQVILGLIQEIYTQAVEEVEHMVDQVALVVLVVEEQELVE
jgi:hypothetical protein